ncbi:hydrogenase maturation protease [Aliiglaciecola sp. CAU 1673]|uniref:hydrogenase maturation protease n=1 Tax=Aliiglaciecola sp. CAU 1673 TaxID=3032595 RepID=UPI0023DC2587|nr:hydrogenase maturation protease [Aliiglaciecola sp. CAU 1673]MDF2180184.1 hydrogenase maturation protease [Aliiglaciecola sp. CAU 1673]
MKKSQIRILCLGNKLHGDDGIGSRVFEELCHMCWPHHIGLIDAGVGGVALVPLFSHCDRVILVDALLDPKRPGKIVVKQNLDLYELHEDQPLVHGGRLDALLSMLPSLIQPLPRIDLFAITAKDFSNYSNKLSPEAQRAIPELCEKLLESLEADLAQYTGHFVGAS